ncbi:hypothetical protein M422DRAFT_90380, partial [Sphaerobolus stellatus SS14]
LMDSGCSNCMTPQRDALKNFTKIPPKLFCAANKQSFQAIGKGEMVIEVPNG